MYLEIQFLLNCKNLIQNQDLSLLDLKTELRRERDAF